MNRSLMAVVLLILTPLCVAAEEDGASADNGAQTVTAPVQIAQVVNATLKHHVQADGVIAPDSIKSRDMTLSSDVLVGSVWVHEGQAVKRGEKLFSTRPAATTRVAYGQARADLDFAQQEMKRIERLRKQGLAGNEQASQARENLSKAQAAYEVVRTLGRPQVQNTSADGVVVNLGVVPGKELPAGQSALTIVASGRVAKLALLPEYASRVAIENVVDVVDVFDPAHTCKGAVTSVGESVSADSISVPVVITLPHSCQGWRVGGAVRATIEDYSEQTLAVPISAVLGSDANEYVYVIDRGFAHKVTVRTGLEDGDQIAVSGDLKAGQQVVVQGNYELSDGMAVKVVQ